MSNEIRDQYVRDMQVAGLALTSQKRYLSLTNCFFKETWLEPASVTERDLQDFLISLRDKNVARETFRGYRYALQLLFATTLERDWSLFKKNCARHLRSACLSRWNTRNVRRC